MKAGGVVRRPKVMHTAVALADYLKAQRWFRAKARTIVAVEVRDEIELDDRNSRVLVATVSYNEGEPDTYLLAFTAEGGDALTSAAFRDNLLDAIACNRAYGGRAGILKFERTSALDRECGARTQTRKLPFARRAEQQLHHLRTPIHPESLS